MSDLVRLLRNTAQVKADEYAERTGKNPNRHGYIEWQAAAEIERLQSDLEAAHERGDEYMRRGDETYVELETARAEIGKLRAVVDEFTDLMSESRGVDGLHLNGDLADWDWLMNNSWLARYKALGDEA